MTNTTRLHPDADFIRSGFPDIPLAKLKRTASLGYLDNSHRARLERVRTHYSCAPPASMSRSIAVRSSR